MEVLQKIVSGFEKVPEWAFLYVVPALILATALGFVFAPKRRWYFCIAAFLSAAGSLTVYAKNARISVFYAGLAVVFTALCALLFFIPRPQKGKKQSKMSREERLYEKFHEELSEEPYHKSSSMPPKVCCFDEEKEENKTAADCGTSLSYADSLLEKLRSKKLNAGDRLETEELMRRLNGYRNKPLSPAERDSLNDCLASVLKLTAKYQL